MAAKSNQKFSFKLIEEARQLGIHTTCSAPMADQFQAYYVNKATTSRNAIGNVIKTPEVPQKMMTERRERNNHSVLGMKEKARGTNDTVSQFDRTSRPVWNDSVSPSTHL